MFAEAARPATGPSVAESRTGDPRALRSPDASPSPGPVPAIVLGEGVTALGALRALGARGIPTFLLSAPGDVASRSRWAHPPPTPSSAPLSAHALPEALLSSGLHGGVLFPCSDSLARAVASLPSELGARFRSTIPRLDVLDRFIDKHRFAEVLATHGIPHPLTVQPESGGALDRVPEGAFASAFLKPRDSQRFFARYGVKAVKVRDRQEAEKLTIRLREAGHAMVLQEYVPGPPTSHVFLDGFVTRAGRISHLLARRRLRMYPEDFGNSTVCETIPLDSVQPAIRDLVLLLRHTSYRGIFSAEVKQDERDGIFRFLEVNARVWWYAGFAAQCGVNVCEAAYRDTAGTDLVPMKEARPGIRLVYPSHDLAAFRMDRSRPPGLRAPLSTGDWFGKWLRAHQPIWSLSDPGPGVWTAGHWLARKLTATLDR